MARPNKYNLQYFPLDVTFFEDHKTLMIEEDYGFKGGYIAIRLMAMVYEQGFYLDWKDKQEISIAKRIGNGFTGALVLEVLRSCLKHELFDKALFDRHAVLTSNGIQRRWLQVMVQLRRKIEVNSELWLVDSEETRITSEETPTPATFSTQKESKVNETKLKKEVRAKAPTDPKKSKKFIPPSVDLVEKYFLSTIGSSKNPGCWPAAKCRNEAATFVDHYIANGWVQKQGKPIKNWQAACRNWIRNELKGVFSKPQPAYPERKSEKTVVEKLPDPLKFEIDYLIERYIEDEKNVTTMSVLPVHYNYLKSNGFINLSEPEKANIQVMATNQLNGNCTENTITGMMKRLAVLEYFKKLKKESVTP